MSFTQLNLAQPITKALTACGYTKPTPIQAKSIPEILNGNDLVASAQTGTGKTAAFVLPALQHLSENPSKGKPRILILTPTRELATQITKAAGLYGKFLRFNIVSLVGGMPYRQQLKDLSRQVDIVVATPGRLLDHVENKRLDLSGIEILILDEADRMLDMGFIDDIKAITQITPKQRQTLLFSATVDQKLSSVIRQLLKDPVKIDLSEKTLAPSKIKQLLYLTDSPQHKSRLLYHFLDNENIFKGIIFSATKINADKLADELNDQGYAAAALHGDLRQNVRNRTVEQLRRGKIQFLVATDVAARGIDISDVTHVINYDLPKFSEDYVHRIGRTGRAGKTGIAISFALPSDTRHIQKIERYIGQSFERSVISGLEPKKSSTNATSFVNKKKASGKSSKYSDSKYSNTGSHKNAKSSKRPAQTGSKADTFTDKNFEKRPRSSQARGDSKSKRHSEDRDQYFAEDRKSSRSTHAKNEKTNHFSDENKREARRFSEPKGKRFADNRTTDKADRFSREDKVKTANKPASSKAHRFSESSILDKPTRFARDDKRHEPRSAEGRSKRSADGKTNRFSDSSRLDKPTRFARDDRRNEPRSAEGRSKRSADGKTNRFSDSSRLDKPTRFARDDRRDEQQRSTEGEGRARRSAASDKSYKGRASRDASSDTKQLSLSTRKGDSTKKHITKSKNASSERYAPPARSANSKSKRTTRTR